MNPGPSIYKKANATQRRDAKEILREYSEMIQWKFDGEESVLDVGCGPGDVTVRAILPIMPRVYGKLVGVDISDEMIDYANRCYGNERVSFELLDIAGDVESFLQDHPDGFDHIISLYCLHFVHDQKKALQNIYALLKPKADCLLVVLTKHPGFRICKEQCLHEKWSAFMPNVSELFAPYCDHPDAKTQINKLLEEVGFTSFDVKIKEISKLYIGKDEIKDNTAIVNPVWPKLSAKERDEYLNDYLNHASQMDLFTEATNDNECELFLKHKLAIIYAVKEYSYYVPKFANL